MKYLLVALLLLTAVPAHAMQQPIFGPIGMPAPAGGGGTNFYHFGIGSYTTALTTYVNAMSSVAVAGTVSGFTATLDSVAAAGTTITVTLMVNNANTAISCDIIAPSKTCSDADTVTVAPGQTWALKASIGATPSYTTTLSTSAIFTGTTDGESLIVGATGVNLSNSLTQYYTPYGGTATTTLAQATTTMPTGGTIDNLYATTSAIVGAAASGKAYDITVYKNGIAQSLTCQIFENSTGCNDTSAAHAISYVAGDSINITYVPTASPTLVRSGWGVRFKPTINGESLLFDRLNSFSNAIRYESIAAAVGPRELVEASSTVAAPLAFDLKKEYFATVYGQPTGVTSRTATARKNSASTGSPGNLSATVNASVAFASDLTNVASYTTGDLVDWTTTVSGTPPSGTLVLAFLSAVAYVAPPTAFHCSGYINGAVGYIMNAVGFCL